MKSFFRGAFKLLSINLSTAIRKYSFVSHYLASSAYIGSQNAYTRECQTGCIVSEQLG
jgi:hypothetical protein